MASERPTTEAEVSAARLHATTDASIWVEEFDRIYPDRRPDTDTMLGWFANAIEVGRMAGAAEARAALIDELVAAVEKEPNPFDEGSEFVTEFMQAHGFEKGRAAIDRLLEGDRHGK